MNLSFYLFPGPALQLLVAVSKQIQLHILCADI